MGSSSAQPAASVRGAARAGARAGAPRAPELGTPRALALRGLHLGVLYALAVAQPLLNLLGNNAVFFASRRSSPGQVVTFALLVVLVPPLAGTLVELLADRADRRAGQAVHLVLVGVLVALVAVQVVKKAHPPTGVDVVLAVGVAMVGSWLYARSGSVRSVATWFSPLPLLVLALFLFGTPVHRIVFANDAAAANVSTKGSTPIVMVVFDEFTGSSLLDARHRIDPVLYPSFARLARQGTYFRNFTAPGDETTRMISALLTGTGWLPGKPLPITADYPHNLFTLLGRSYRMRVSEEASDLCPPSLCRPIRGTTAASSGLSNLFHDAGIVYLHQVSPPAVERHLTPVDQTLGEFEDEDGKKDAAPAPGPPAATAARRRHDASDVLAELGGGRRQARFDSWLRSIDGSPRKTLYFKHVLLPHVPWQYLGDGRSYRRNSLEYIAGLNGPPSFDDPWLLQQGYQRHLLQVQLADRMLGQVVARLKQTGLYDRSLLVVTADNGESFLHAGHDRHVADRTTVQDVASTPLLIKRPYQRRGGYSDRHVRTFDVVPTIADVVGVRMPWKLAGRSIFDPHAQIPTRVDVIPIMNTDHRLISMSLADYEARERRAVAAKVALFGSDGRGPGLFGLGPHRELIGRPVASLAPEPAGGVSAAFTDPGLVAGVSTRSEFIPAQLTGHLSGGVAQARPMAIAVDGTIAAVGRVARLKGDPRPVFSFMLPPSAFHDGDNTAQVFLVDEDASGAVRGLRLVGSAG